MEKSKEEILYKIESLSQVSSTPDGKKITVAYLQDQLAKIVFSHSQFQQEETNIDADSAWPLSEVLKKLIEAADILLNKKDYDGHGWEEISHAVKKAKTFSFTQQEDRIVYGEWQLCPKCAGEGQIYRQDVYNDTTALSIGWFTCPVCNGAKVLARPKLFLTY